VKRLRLIAVLLSAAALSLALGYAVWRRSLAPPAYGPPPINLEDVDPQVVRAVSAARDAVNGEPTSAAAWGRLGMVLFAHEFNAEALKCFARAEELDAGEMRWPYYQGVLLANERPAEAVAPLQRAAERAGREPLPRLRLAETFYVLDRLDEAEAQFRKAPAGRDEEPRVLLGLGLIAWRRGDLKDCLPLLERAASDPHARRIARAALADVQQRLGNVAGAERLQAEAARLPKDPPWPDHLIERVAELQTGTRPRINQINNLLLAGRVREALDLCRQVVREDPNSEIVHLAYGRALMQAREYSAAAEELADATRRWPDSIDAHLMLGGALSAVGQYSDAARSYRRVTELSPAHALAHFYLATCLRRNSDRTGARRALSDAIRCRPDLEAAHVDLGELLLDDGDPAAAASHLRDALRLDPADERAKRLLADAEAKMKKQSKPPGGPEAPPDG
jgi:tetratricopeptide (TPR) repeat protein